MSQPMMRYSYRAKRPLLFAALSALMLLVTCTLHAGWFNPNITVQLTGHDSYIGGYGTYEFDETDGTATYEIDVTRSSEGTYVHVYYEILTEGSDTADSSDFDQVSSGLLSWSPSDNNPKKIPIRIHHDNSADDETFTVRLIQCSGASCPPGVDQNSPGGAIRGTVHQAKVTINDDELDENPQVALEMPVHSRIQEGPSESPRSTTVRLKLNRTMSGSTTVYFNSNNSTATRDPNDDFVIKKGSSILSDSVTIPGGQLYTDLTIEALDDNIHEGIETAQINITSANSGGSSVAVDSSNNSRTVEIESEDSAPVLFIASNSVSTLNEAGPNGIIIFELNRPSTENVQFGFKVTNGTASSGDYNINHQPMTFYSFGPLETKFAITITPTNPFIPVYEGDETLTFSIHSTTVATFDPQETHVVTIQDDENPPLVSLGLPQGSELQEDENYLQLIPQYNIANQRQSTVAVSLPADSIAADGQVDYWVNVLQETMVDASNSNVTWYSSPSGGAANVVNDSPRDRDVLHFTSSNCGTQIYSGATSYTGSFPRWTTWVRTTEACSAIRFNAYATVDGLNNNYSITYYFGTGTNSADDEEISYYLGNIASGQWTRLEQNVKADLEEVLETSVQPINISGPYIYASDLKIDDMHWLRDDIHFPANIKTGSSILVESDNDNRYENTQYFTISLLDGSPTNDYNLNPTGSSRSISLTDDDGPPLVSFVDSSVTVDEGDTEEISIELSHLSELTTTANFSMEPGTASVSGGFADSTLNPAQVVFAPLITENSFDLSTTEDNRHETDETLTVTIISTINAHPDSEDEELPVTINNDDDPSTVAVADIAVLEDEGPAILTFNLDRPAGEPASFSYTTNDGTAESVSDYTARIGTIEFAEGQSQKTLSIEITNEDENLLEDDEMFTVTLSGGFLTLPASNPQVTILNDDPLFTIPLENATIDNGTLLRLPGILATGVTAPSNLNYDWQIIGRDQSVSTLLEIPEFPETPLYVDATTPTLSGTTTIQTNVVDTKNDNRMSSNTMTVTTTPWQFNAEFSPIRSLITNAEYTTGTIELGWSLENLEVLTGTEGPVYFYSQRASESPNTSELWQHVDGQTALIASGERLLAAALYLENDGLERQLIATYQEQQGRVVSRSRTGRAGVWSGPVEIVEDTGSFVYDGQADIARFVGRWYVAVSSSESAHTTLFQTSAGGDWENASVTLASGLRFPSLSVSRNQILSLAATTNSNVRVYAMDRGGSWSDSVDGSPSGTATSLKSTTDAFGHLWISRSHDNGGSDAWDWFLAPIILHGTPPAPADYADYALGAVSSVSITGGLPAGFTAMRHRNSLAADQGGYLYVLGTSSTMGSLQMARLEANSFSNPTSLVYNSGNAPVLPLSHRSLPGRADSFGSIEFGADGIAYVAWQPSRFIADSVYLLAREYHNFLQVEEGASYSIHANLDLAVGLQDPVGAEATFAESLSGNNTLSEIRLTSGTFTIADWISAESLLQGPVEVLVSESPSGWAYDAGLRGVTVQHRTQEGRLLWPARDLVVYADESSAQVTSMKIADYGSDGLPPLQPVTRDIIKDADQYHEFGVLFEYSPPLGFNLNADDVAWRAEGGVGRFEAPGLFRATGLGAGTVHAYLETQNISSFAYVFVGREGEVAYYEILPREETVLGLNERVTFQAIGFDFGGNRVLDAKPFWELQGPGQLLQDGTYLGPSDSGASSAVIVVSDQEAPSARGTKPLYIDSMPPRVLNFSVNGLDDPEGQELSGDLLFHWDLQEIPTERSMPVRYSLFIGEELQIGSTHISDQTTSASLKIPTSALSLPLGEQTFRIVAVDSRGNSNAENAPSFRATIDRPGGLNDINGGIDWLLANQYRNSEQRYVGSWKNDFDRTDAELLMEAAQATRVLGTSVLHYRASDPAGVNVHDGEFYTVARAYHDGIVWLVREVEAGSVSSFLPLAMVHETLAEANNLRPQMSGLLKNIDPAFNRATQLAGNFIDEVIDPQGARHAAIMGAFAASDESRSTRLETLAALRVLQAADRRDVLGQLLNVKDENEESAVYSYFANNLSFAVNEEGELEIIPFENLAGWTNAPNRQASANGVENGEQDSLYLSAETADLLLRQERDSATTVLSWLLDGSLHQFLTQLQQAGESEEGGFPAGAESVIDTASLTKFLVRDALKTVEAAVERRTANADGRLVDLSNIENPHYDLINEPLVGGSEWLRYTMQVPLDGSWNGRAFDTASAVEVLRPELLITQVEYDYAQRGFLVEVANLGAISAQGVRVSLLEQDAEKLVPSEIVVRRAATSFAQNVQVSRTLANAVEFFIEYEPPVYPPTISLVVNGERNHAEYEFDNNIKKWSLPDGPNLKLQEDSLLAVDSSMRGLPLVGQPWILQAKLFNLGRQPVVFRDPKTNGMVNPSRLRIYQGYPRFNPSATPLFTQPMAEALIGNAHGQQLSQLMPGQSIDLAVVVPPGVITTSGRQEIALWVDHASGFNGAIGDIRETDETDNIASSEIEFFLTNSTRERPDLTIDPSALSNNPQWVQCDTTTKLQLWVDNIGAAAAENVVVELIVDDFGNTQSYVIPRIGAKRSHLLEVPLFGGDSPDPNLVARSLNITVDPDNLIDESDERNNDADYFMPLHCVGTGSPTNLAVFSEDIDVKLHQGAYYPTATVVNLGGSIESKALDVEFETRTYSRYRRPRGDFNPHSEHNFPNPGQSAPLFSLPIGYANRFDTSQLQNASPLNPAWVDIAVRLTPDPNDAWDAVSSDNYAVKSIYTGMSDLRVVSMEAQPVNSENPANEVFADYCSSDPALFNIRVTVANGSGEQNLSTVKPIHLVLKNSRTGQVLGAINSVELEPTRILSGGETLGPKTFLFQNIALPISPNKLDDNGQAIDGEYRPHLLAGEIDPFNLFADPDRNNNTAALPITVKQPDDPNYTPIPPDFAIAQENLRVLNENGLVVVAGVAQYLVSPDANDCYPQTAEAASIIITSTGSTDPISGSGWVEVYNVSPGDEVPFVINTGIPATASTPSAIDVFIEWQTDSGAELYTDNNRRPIQLLAPDAPTCDTPLLYASNVVLFWQAPTESPVTVSSYLLRKFWRPSSNPEAEPTLEWVREVSAETTEYLDQNLLTDRLYSYEIYSRGDNSRLSTDPCPVEVEPRSEKPLVTRILDEEMNETHPVNTNADPDRIFLRGFGRTEVIVRYGEDLDLNPTQTLRLVVVDGDPISYTGTPIEITPSDPAEEPYFEYTFVLPAESSAIAQSSKLASAYLELVSGAGQGAKLFANSVILIRDRMADLAYAYDEQSVSRKLELQRWDETEWRTIPFHDLDVFIEEPFRIKTEIENLHNPALRLQDFDVLFEISYKDGSVDRRVVPVAGDAFLDSPNGKVEVASSDQNVTFKYYFAGLGWFFPEQQVTPGLEPFQVPAGKEIDKFRILIDHDETQLLGRVQEINESNNELLKPYYPSFKPMGTEFLVPLPLAHYWKYHEERLNTNPPSHWTREGIDYRFMLISQADETDTEPTIVRFYATVPKYSFLHGGFPIIDGTEEIEVGSVELEAGGREEFKLDPEFELNTRPSTGTWWDNNSSLDWQRAIRIVGGRSKESEAAEAAEFSVTMFDPTNGEENTALLIPTNQLNDNYTIMSYYPSRGWISEVGHNRNVRWEENQGFAYTVFQYFTISTPAEEAKVTITQNFMGVPAKRDFMGEYEQNGNSFTITLKRGQTYSWAPFSWWSDHDKDRAFEASWQDPTGVQVTSDQPIVVASGINSGLPSFDSRHGDHTYSLMHPSGVRGTDFLVPPPPFSLEAGGITGEYTTSFFRVVPTVNDHSETRIWLDADTEPVVLNQGEFLEVSPINPFKYANYHAADDQYAQILSEKEGGEYKWVKRIQAEKRSFHRVRSDKPVLTTQYYISSQNLFGGYGSCRHCHYTSNAGGDPEMIPIIPKRAYSIDEYVSVTLPGESFVDEDYYHNVDRKGYEERSGHLDASPDTLKHPTNFITMVVAEDEDNEFAYNNPEILYRRGKDTDWRNVVDDLDNLSVMRYPRRIEYTEVGEQHYISRILPAPEWEELGWNTDEGFLSAGYRLLTLNIKTWNKETRNFEFWNKNNLPLMLMTAGFQGKYSTRGHMQASSYGNTAIYRYVDLVQEEKIDGVDLALTAASIRLPFTGEKIRPGETTPFLLEIANLGTQDAATQETIVQVLHVERDEDGNESTTAILPSNADMSELPEEFGDISGYVITSTVAAEGHRVIGWLSESAGNQAIFNDEKFVFTPTENTVGLRAYVAYAPGSEQVVTNNFAERPLQFSRPELFIRWVEYSRPNEGQNQYALSDRQPAVLDGTGSNPEVELDEQLNFVVQALSTELLDNSVKVRYSAATPSRGTSVSGFANVTFNSNDVVTLSGSRYYIANVTVPVTHSQGGRYTLGASVDADEVIEEDNEDNNSASYLYDVRFPQQGNMVVKELRFYRNGIEVLNPTFYVDETIEARATLDVVSGEYPNPVNQVAYFGNPDDGNAVRASDITPTASEPGTGEMEISVDVTFTSPYNGYLFMTANIDRLATPPERNYADNKSGRRIRVLKSEAQSRPDLITGYPRVSPNPAYRTAEGDLWPQLRLPIYEFTDSVITNPFKVQVFLNSADDNQKDVVAERIFEPGDGTQTSWMFEEYWSTTRAPLGENTLTFVVDSPNHLAAVGTNASAGSSRSPLIGKKLRSQQGISLQGLSETARAADVRVRVYAVSSIAPTSSTVLLGTWSVSGGYTNAAYDEDEGDFTIFEAEESAPLLVVLDTLTDEPFPVRESALALTLRLDQQNLEGVSTTVELPVALPANGRLGWGSAAAFWIANDGSSFFTRNLHLASDFTGGAPVGSDLVDMDSTIAMSDGDGSIAEIEELANNRRTTSIEVLPRLTDLTVALSAEPVNASSGETIRFTADMLNDGVPNDRSFAVALSLFDDAHGTETPIAEFEELVVGPVDFGTTRTITVDWHTNTFSGNYRAEVTVDAGQGTGVIAESDESNNTDSLQGSVSANVQLALIAAPSTVSVDQPVTVTISVQSDIVTSGSLSLRIIDDVTDGVVAEGLLSGTGISPFNLQGTHLFEVPWNVGAQRAGAYRAEGTLSRLLERDYGHPVTAQSNSFEILPDRNLAGFVSTNRSTYECGEAITINAWLENRSRNFDYGPIDVAIELLDSYGNIYPIGSTQLDYLLKDRRTNFRYTWEDPILFSSSMDVVLTARELDGPSTATAVASFTHCASNEFVVEPDYGKASNLEKNYTTSLPNSLDSLLYGLGGNTQNMLLLVEDQAAVAATAFNQRNIFSNADFEDPLGGVFLSTGETGLVAPTRVEGMGVEGSTAISVTGQSGEYLATGTDADALRIRPSTNHVLSFYGQQTDGRRVTVQALQTDRDGFTTQTLVGNVSLSPQWTRHQVSFKSLEETESLSLRFYLSGAASAEFLFDNVQLETGRVASSFAQHVAPGIFKPLLANPLLTLDEGRLWSELNPELEPGTNNAEDGLPDGWRILTGAGNVTINSGASLPEALGRVGATGEVLITTGAAPVQFRQGLIPVVEASDYVLSLFAKGTSSDLRQLIRFYDETGSEVGTATESTEALASSYDRYELSATVPAGAVFAAIEFKFSSSTEGSASMVAAQFELGTVATTWKGWVPYFNVAEARPLPLNLEGEYAVSYRALNQSNQEASLSSMALLRDANRDGRFDGLGAVDPSYRFTITDSNGTTRTESATSLFDGEPATALLLEQDVTSAELIFTVPTRPMLDQLSFDVAGFTAGTGSYQLDGRYMPGSWKPVLSGILAEGTNSFSEIGSAYGEYRLTISNPSGNEAALGDIFATGYFLDASDLLVYDVTAPSVTITVPAPETALTKEVAVAVQATDNLAGVGTVAFTITDAQGFSLEKTVSNLKEDGLIVAKFDALLLAEGTATINATATDHAGNSAPAAPVNVTIDRTAPVLSGPVALNLTTGNHDWLRSGEDVQLRVMTNELPTTASLFFADLRMFNGLATTPAETFDGSTVVWNVPEVSTSLPDGLIKVPLWGYDDAGNRSETAFATITLDNTAPSSILLSSLEETFNVSELNFEGLALDNSEGQIASVTASLDSGSGIISLSFIDEVPDSSSEYFKVEIASLTDGDHCLTFITTDAAGNQSLSEPYCLNVDAGGPVIEWVRITDTTINSTRFIRSEDNALVEVRFGEDSFDAANVFANLSPLGYFEGAIAYPTDDPRILNWPLTKVQTGEVDDVLEIIVDARDFLGRTTSGSGSIIADNTPPQLNDFEGPPLLTSSANVSFSGVVADSTPGLLESVEYRVREIARSASPLQWKPVPASFDLATSESAVLAFDFEVGPLTDQTYVFELRATDMAQWPLDEEDGIFRHTFTVDTQAPNPQLLVYKREGEQYRGAPRFIRNGDDLRFVVRPNDATATTSSISLDLSNIHAANPAYEAVNPESFVPGEATWHDTVVETNPSDGITTFTATVTDLASLVGTASVEVIADNTSPTIVQLVLDDDVPIYRFSEAIIRGQAFDPAPGELGTVQYRRTDIPDAPWQLAESTRFTNLANFVTRIPVMADGYYSFEFRAIDLAGNVSLPESIYFTLDTSNLPAIDLAELNDETIRSSIFTRDGHQVTLSVELNPVPGVDYTTASLAADLSELGGPSFTYAEVVDYPFAFFNLPVSDNGGFTAPRNAAVWLETAQGPDHVTTATIVADNSPPVASFLEESPYFVQTVPDALTAILTDALPYYSGPTELYVHESNGSLYNLVIDSEELFGDDETPTFQSYTFDIPLDPDLPDGVYTFQIGGRDFVGNEVATSPTLTMQLDSGAPTGSLVLLSPALTNEDEAQLSGIASDKVGGSGIVSVSFGVNGSSEWTEITGLTLPAMDVTFDFEAPLPLEGTNTIALRIIDRAGNEYVTPSVDVIRDTMPPLMVVDSPTSFTWTNTPQVVSWSQITTETISELAILERTTFQDINTNRTVQNGEAVSGEGRYHLDVWGTDQAGNESASASTAFGIDFTSPTLLFDEPSSIHGYGSIIVSGNATDDDQSGISDVSYSLNGGLPSLAAWDAVASRFTVTEAELAEGTHLLAATALDVAGNVSVPTTHTLTVDLTGPEVAVTSATQLDGLFQHRVSGTVSDALTAPSSVEWKRTEAIIWNPADFDGVGSYTFDTAFTVGNNLFDVRAYDLVGNVSTISATLYLDDIPPVMVIDAPTSGTWYNVPVEVRWSAVEEVAATSSGILLHMPFSEAEPTTRTVTWGEVIDDEGRFVLDVIGADKYGNVSEPVTLPFGIDMTSPTATLIADALTNAEPVTLSGTAEDELGSGVERLSIRDNGGSWNDFDQQTTVVDNFYPQFVDFLNNLLLAHGQNQSVQVRAIDGAGNESTPTSTTISVDLISPYITVQVPSSEATISGDEVSILATITDDFVGVDTSELDLLFSWAGNSEILNLVAGDSPDGYEQTLNTWRYGDGPATLTFTAADTLGNDSVNRPNANNPVTVNVTVDNDYPPMAPTGVRVAYVSYTEAEITWNKNSEDDLSHYLIYREETDSGSITDSDLLNPSSPNVYDTPEDLRNRFVDVIAAGPSDPANAPGFWDFAIRAVDLAGNESLFSKEVTIDAPMAPGNLQALARDAQVDLSWSPVNEGFVLGYKVYRRPITNPETAFTEVIEVLGSDTTATSDTAVVNNSDYEYLIRAFDGAYNESGDSNIARAMPIAGMTTVREKRFALFESWSKHISNDWDYEDVGARVDALIALDANDNVTTITITMEGFFGFAGSSHNMFLDIVELSGTADYSWRFWDHGKTPFQDTPSDSATGTYSWQSLASRQGIPVFIDTKGKHERTGKGEFHGTTMELSLVVNDPSQNPFSSFDRVPYDLHIFNRDTKIWIYIYDPETGDYFDDNQMVPEGESALYGTYLNGAIVVPFFDFVPPAQDQPIWEKYPEFIDYATSVRSEEIKNRDWYYNAAP